MAEEELTVVRLHEDFYRDSFGKVIFIICATVASILFLGFISVYLFITKPPPVTFVVANEWRVQAPVPVQKPYLSDADLIQWVSNVVPRVFDFNFLHMDKQLKDVRQYFTEDGYEKFITQLNNRISSNTVKKFKLFVRAEPTSAPFILNKGVLSGRYAWWVQIPVEISYAGMRIKAPEHLQLQVLVERTETTSNLDGVLIDNVITETKARSAGIGI